MLGFPENWLVAVTYISISSKPNFAESSDALNTLKAEIQSLKNEGKSELDVLAECRRTETLSAIDIFKMTDLKIGETRDVLFEVDQEIRGLFDTLDDSRSSIFEQKINIVKYYRYLFESVLKVNRMKNFYWESIVECTLINSNQVGWECQETAIPDGFQSYLYTQDLSSSLLQDLIRNHDTNIRVLMNTTSALSLSDGFNYIMASERDRLDTNHDGDRFIQSFERFVLSLVTLLKMHEYFEVALEYVILYRQLNSTEYSQSKLLACSIKIELFACDVMYRKLKKSRDYCSTEDITAIEVQFKIVESLLQKCDDTDWYLCDLCRIMYQSEFDIVKFYTLKLDKVKRHKKEIELEAIIKELISIQTKINADKASNMKFLFSKISFVIMEYYVEKKQFSDVDIQNTKAAVKIFREYKSYKLEAKALIMLSELYENTPQDSLSYAKHALAITKSHSIKELDKEIKQLIVNANTSIRHQFQNKFYFLSCYPLRDQPEPVCGGINFSKNLREEIMPHLKHFDHSILVHFDIFTNHMLQELLKENVGCKLLVVDFLYLPEGGIVLEAPGLGEEYLEFETIKNILSMNHEKKIHVDILLVLSNQRRDIITEFADACDIPLTIYFDFKKSPSSNYDIMVQYLRREYMYMFMKDFTASLITGKKAYHAIENARNDAIEQILFAVRRKQMNLYHVQANDKDNNFYTTQENWSVEIVEEVLRDAVQIHERHNGLNMTCELSKGRLVFYSRHRQRY